MDPRPNTRGSAGAKLGSERALTDEPSSVADPGNNRNGGIGETDAREDWLSSLATADPSLWLRDVDL